MFGQHGIKIAMGKKKRVCCGHALDRHILPPPKVYPQTFAAEDTETRRPVADILRTKAFYPVVTQVTNIVSSLRRLKGLYTL